MLALRKELIRGYFVGLVRLLFGQGFKKQTLRDTVMPEEAQPHVGTVLRTAFRRLRGLKADASAQQEAPLSPESFAAVHSTLRNYLVGGLVLVVMAMGVAVSSIWYGSGYLLVAGALAVSGGLITFAAVWGVRHLAARQGKKAGEKTGGLG